MSTTQTSDQHDLVERLSTALSQACCKADGSPADWLEYPGDFFWSPLSSLSRGDFYVLGLNPGGKDGSTKATEQITLAEQIRPERLAVCTKHSYFEEKAEYKRYRDGLINLARLLNVDWKQDLFCSNLAFVRTADTKELLDTLKLERKSDNLGFTDLVEAAFWRAQLVFLDEVRPRCIITIGNGRYSAYEMLRKLLNGADDEDISGLQDSNEPRVKAFKCKPLEGRTYPECVIGLRHFSRWPKIPEETLRNMLKHYRLDK